jgi:hypothetical protein
LSRYLSDRARLLANIENKPGVNELSTILENLR